MSVDIDDPPALSDSALTALLSFYAEQNEENDRLERLKSSTSHGSESTSLSISSFKEDWHASQFWFTDETARYLAERLLLHSSPESCIAVVSAPTVYIQLRNLLTSGKFAVPERLQLFEYDTRFELLDGYVKYDFNEPADIPGDMMGAFDTILWDPPYHSQACMVQYAKTVKLLAKETHLENDKAAPCRKILCTGEVLEDAIRYTLPELKVTTFRPQHTMRLDNRYACFANFNLDEEKD